MIKRNIFGRKILLAAALALLFAAGANAHDGDWFSADTLSSVVKLSSVLKFYDVEGLPENYTFKLKGGKPDFGDANVISQESVLAHVGSGVVVTRQGLILSNAHVTRAYCYPAVGRVTYSDGSQRMGPNGKPLFRVRWNPLPACMFVGVSERSRLERNDDAQRLMYVAYVLTDDPDYNYSRDRAILKVFSTAHLSNEGMPVADDDIDSSLNMSWVALGNPFATSYSDKSVRAIGFPGTGDPNRSARTAGELLGYQNERRSILLHTSYISGGNSGGGLFYNDKLIGINTWDYQRDPSRPVAEAQPITYWIDMFSKVSWLYPNVDLPEASLQWIRDDPSTEAYKNMAQIGFEVVEPSNQNVPVTKGKLYVHKKGTTIQEVLDYKGMSNEFAKALILYRQLVESPLDEVVKKTGCDRNVAKVLANLPNESQIRNILKDSIKPYFDIWWNDGFFYEESSLDSDNGKAMVSVPKNTDVQVTYMSEDGKYSVTYNLGVDGEYLQGPYTIPAKR